LPIGEGILRKTLTQDEIDSLFSGAQARPDSSRRTASKSVARCDLSHWNRLSENQIGAVGTLHGVFARRLSSSLGALFRVAFSMNLVSVEQMTYREFLGRLPELSYCAAIRVLPLDVQTAIQLDISLAYPIVDVVLGGSATAQVEARDLTEIEEQILETVFRLIVQDLRDSWAPILALEFRFEQRQRNLQMQGMILPGEKILCLSFEMQIAEFSGNLAMVFPAVVASALLRRLAVQGSYSERTPSRESRRRMRERLLDCRFKTDLSLPASLLPIRRLLNLEPGEILLLPKRADEPIHLNVAGKPLFSAYPVGYGAQRAARISERLSGSSGAGKSVQGSRVLAEGD